MSTRRQLEKDVEAIDKDYYVEYHANNLWHGSQCAARGWYLRSRKWAADDGLGRGKYLGKNINDAIDTVDCSIL